MIVLCIVGGCVYDNNGVCEISRAYVCESSLESKCLAENDVECAAWLVYFFLKVVDCCENVLWGGVCIVRVVVEMNVGLSVFWWVWVFGFMRDAYVWI